MKGSRSTTSRISAEVQLAIADVEKNLTAQNSAIEEKVSRAIQAVKEDVIRDHGETTNTKNGLEDLKIEMKSLTEQVRSLWWKMGLIMGGVGTVGWILTTLLRK